MSRPAAKFDDRITPIERFQGGGKHGLPKRAKIGVSAVAHAHPEHLGRWSQPGHDVDEVLILSQHDLMGPAERGEDIRIIRVAQTGVLDVRRFESERLPEPFAKRRWGPGINPDVHAAISVCGTRGAAKTRHARMSSGSRYG